MSNLSDSPSPTETSLKPSPSQTTQERIVSNEQSDSRNRERITLGVLITSIASVFLLSVSVILNAADRDDSSKKVMDSRLPLYGTWIGTILAFYFSRNAFEAASSATAWNAAVFQQVSGSLCYGYRHQ